MVIEAVAPDAVGVGLPLTYELVVRNTGPAAVTGVRVEEELPAKCQVVGTEPPAESTGDRLTWTVGTLDAGAEKRIKVTVKPAEEGEVRSRATVTFAASVETRVKVTRPKITLALVGPNTSRVGDRVPFQIQITNSGSGPAGTVLLQAKFSDGLTHPAGAVIEAPVKDLPAGQTKTLNLEVLAAKAGKQACTLAAVADGTPCDPAKAEVTLVEPLLAIKQTGPTRCLVKGEPTYTIELSNPGTAPTDALQVWSALPAGFEFVQATDGGAFLDANRSVGWRLQQGIPAGGSKSLTLKLKAVAPAEGVISTQALLANAVEPAGGVTQAAVGSPPPGLQARATTPVKAEGVPALRFEVQDVDDPVETGKEAVYEIRVVNQGTGDCLNVQITCDLAETTVATAAAGPDGATGSLDGSRVTFPAIAKLGVKKEVAYRVKVKGTQPGDYRFRVRLASDNLKTPVVKEENTRFTKE